jgi:hypothetical protein
VQGVCQNSKDLAIPPSTIASWIKDLVACHFSNPDYYSLEKNDGEATPNHLKISASPQYSL